MRLYGLKKMMRLAVVGLVLAVETIPAQAIPITVHFEATFTAPTNPVTGNFVYEAASTTANISSLSSIDLTIEGHTYSLSEVGFVTHLDISGAPFPSSGFGQNIGGLIGGGVTSIGPNAFPDFWLLWDQTQLVGLQFIYTTSAPGGSTPPGVLHLTNSIALSVTTPSAAVPEPTTMLLLGSGLLGLWGARRKLRK